jgi:predicted lysophospholipase L1 biosynthesis ABC-type transport system permease subunit
MPITPFHFGPGALLHAMAPRHVSFIAFCAANVLIDVESLYNLIHHRHPVHAFFHTYAGATLVALACIVAFVVWSRLSTLLPLPRLLAWQPLRLRQVALGAVLGAWSHVALDSLMHADIAPLAPVTHENALLGAVGLGVLHWSCLLAGLIGLAVLRIRRLLATADHL